jgi:hypothetical protein
MIYLLKAYASSSANELFLYNTKYLYFVSLSVTTRIESYSTLVISSLDFGSFVMKSIAIYSQAPFGVCGGLSRLYSLRLMALFLW